MHVFILKLRGDHYYIGKIAYPPSDLAATFDTPFTPWVRRFPFEGLVFLYPIHPHVAEIVVNQLVAKVMLSHGVNSVRGGVLNDGRHFNKKDRGIINTFLDHCFPQSEWDRWVAINLSCDCVDDCHCHPGAASAARPTPVTAEVAGQLVKNIVNK